MLGDVKKAVTRQTLYLLSKSLTNFYSMQNFYKVLVSAFVWDGESCSTAEHLIIRFLLKRELSQHLPKTIPDNDNNKVEWLFHTH